MISFSLYFLYKSMTEKEEEEFIDILGEAEKEKNEKKEDEG